MCNLSLNDHYITLHVRSNSTPPGGVPCVHDAVFQEQPISMHVCTQLHWSSHVGVHVCRSVCGVCVCVYVCACGMCVCVIIIMNLHSDTHAFSRCYTCANSTHAVSTLHCCSTVQ